MQWTTCARPAPLHGLFILSALCLTCVTSIAAIANGVDLRILPLGDSITYGEYSSDGNGYRLALATLIKENGNQLQYIGRVQSGNMTDNHHEGHGGFQIGPVGNTGKPDYPDRPNVVLLMAGTNDLVFNFDVDKAPRRLASLIDEINTACPDAAVLVGTLLPLIHPKENPKLGSKDTEAFNSAVKDVISKLAGKGKHVVQVDMSRVNTSYIRKEDGIHPTDQGYALIADAWHDGLVAAGDKGWIKKPVDVPSSDNSDDGNDKSLVDDHVNKDIDGGTSQKTWKLGQLMIVVLILLGLVWILRRFVVVPRRR